MGNLWLKIKIWTKGIIFGALLIYVLVFLLKNSDETANIWFWFFKTKYQISVLILAVAAFLVGVLGTVLVRTTLRTIHQVRDLRQRGRLDRVEREQAEMKAKAAMLQVKTPPPTNAERGAVNDQQ